LAAAQFSYKEVATKVVELQRQVMSLRGKLRQKEQVESENEKLRRELNEFKTKYLESQKKTLQL